MTDFTADPAYWADRHPLIDPKTLITDKQMEQHFNVDYKQSCRRHINISSGSEIISKLSFKCVFETNCKLTIDQVLADNPLRAIELAINGAQINVFRKIGFIIDKSVNPQLYHLENDTFQLDLNINELYGALIIPEFTSCDLYVEFSCKCSLQPRHISVLKTSENYSTSFTKRYVLMKKLSIDPYDLWQPVNHCVTFQNYIDAPTSCIRFIIIDHDDVPIIENVVDNATFAVSSANVSGNYNRGDNNIWTFDTKTIGYDSINFGVINSALSKIVFNESIAKYPYSKIYFLSTQSYVVLINDPRCLNIDYLRKIGMIKDIST